MALSMKWDSTGAIGCAIFGGNSNNGALVGAFASNLNNTASNYNWNIGAGPSYLLAVGKIVKGLV